MPTYVYQREDGTQFELEQRITEDALELCPDTGQKVHRVISATNFQLKGSGWYKTDYAGGSGSSSSSGGSSETKASESKSSSADAAKKSTETKPAKTESQKSSE